MFFKCCPLRCIIKKLLNLTIIYLLSKIEDDQVLKNLFPVKMIDDLLKSHHFLKFVSKR